MSVTKILGWGECTAKFGASSYSDIVENSASLSVEEGEEMEATIEGGIAEGRKQKPDKYIIEFDRRLGGTSEVVPGYTEDGGDVAIIPKNVGAVYAQLTGCTRKITLKQDSTDGLVAHYYFKTKGTTDSTGALDDVEIKASAAAGSYTVVSNPTGNPSQLGYYIKNGNVYIHSLDTSVVQGTTYYEFTAAS